MGLLEKLFNSSDKKRTSPESIQSSDNNLQQTVKTTTETYNCCAALYKMDTLPDIEAIPVPTEKFEYNCDFTESIEYVLQRKATQFKKAGNMECAIACLKKSNEIMPFAPMLYSEKDYGRLERYLKMAGKFDEAREASESTQMFLQKTDIDVKELTLNNATQLNTDLLEAAYLEPASETEAKYRGRIFSISGEDSRFPALPEDIWETRLSLSPFIYGISVPLHFPEGQEFEFSNRPFIDDRKTEEIEAFDNMLSEILRKSRNEKEYFWILENLPDIAPKSLSGYSRMKNANSATFKKLCLAAHEKGVDLVIAQTKSGSYSSSKILYTKWGAYEMPDPYVVNTTRGPRHDLKKIEL